MSKVKYIYYCLPLCALSAFSDVDASDFSASIFEKVEYSDNIFLTPSEEQGDTIYNTGVLLGYKNDSERYPTKIELSISQQDYLHNSFSDRTDYYANINSKWIASRERLEWELVDRFQRVPIDTSLANTPTNQENVNYFSTGPNIDLVRTKRSRLILAFRAEDFYYEVSNDDRADYLGSLNWTYKVNARTQFGLNGVYRDVQYDDDVMNENYNRSDYFISLARNGITYALELGLGDTVINRASSENIDHEIVRINYEKQLSRSQKFNLNYNNEVSDYATYSSSIGSASSISTTVTSELFRLEQYVATYSQRASWGGLFLVYTWRDQDYEDVSSDNKNTRADATLKISTERNTNYSFSYAYQTYDWYSSDDGDYIENIVSVGVAKSFATVFDVGFSVRNINRNYNQANDSYDETRAILDLVYRLR